MSLINVLCLYIITLMLFSSRVLAKCEDNVCTPCEYYEFPLSKAFHVGPGLNHMPESLNIIAAGMRVKSILIAQIQVYKVGIYTSDIVDKAIARASKESASSNHYRFLSSYANIGDKIQSALLLKFVRDVDTSKVVNAIVEALSDPKRDSESYKSSLQLFQTTLTASIGANGVKSNDEIEFVYYEKSKLAIFCKGVYTGSVENAELRERLLAVYIGSKSVTPDAVKCLSTRYD